MQKNKKNHLLVGKGWIFLILVFLVLSFFIGSYIKNKKENEINKISVDEKFLFILDSQNNLHLLDSKKDEFLPEVINIANPNGYGITDMEFSPNGYLYAIVSAKPSSYFSLTNRFNQEPFVAMINVNNYRIEKQIKTGSLPNFITFAENGKGYLIHDFEYNDNGGWAISILDSTTNKITGEIKLPGSPYKPKALEDGRIYIPIMGGGEKHYGNSNVIVIDPETDRIEKLFDEDFSELPIYPLYIDIDKNIFYGTIFAYRDEKKSIFEKPLVWEDASNFLLKYDIANKTLLNVEKLDINSSADYKSFKKDNLLYIGYHNSLTCKAGGVLIYDILMDKIINNIIIKNVSFCSKSMDINNNKLYISNPTNKSIEILFKNHSFEEVSTDDWIPLIIKKSFKGRDNY